MADRLKVYGKCPKCGHQVTKEAETGKVTWRGDCGKDGCDGKIIARRQRTPETAASEPAPTPTRKVQKVGYQRPKERPDTNVQPTGTEPATDPPTDPPTQPPGGTNPGGNNQPPPMVTPVRQRRQRAYPYGGIFGW